MLATKKPAAAQKSGKLNYSKWGIIFLIPFFTAYIIFSLLPLLQTFAYSFFERYRSGLTVIGPNFVGLKNYIELLSNCDLLKYTANTIIMWVMGFIPQIAVAMVLAAWFTSSRLRLKGVTFFKTVIYMPNLIMASAISMLFFTLFANRGPINMLLMDWGVIKEPIFFMDYTLGARSLIAFMNFLMWFGNTTIMLMAGMMGIDASLFEAAEVDGATSMQTFWHITIPLLKPMLVYTCINALIGGLQMYDLPQILTNGNGEPDRTTMTLIMYLNKHLFNQNYGMAGALSVMIFIITGALSLLVFRALNADRKKDK